MHKTSSLVSEYNSLDSQLTKILDSDPYDGRIEDLRERLEDLWYKMDEDERETVTWLSSHERVERRR